MKILIIGDIHIGVSKEYREIPGIYRQANTEAEETLRKLVPHLNSQHLDLVIHMGDAVQDTKDKMVDKENLKIAFDLLAGLKAPSIHLPGNHEHRTFTKDELYAIYKELGADTPPFGTKELDGVQIVWLDIDRDETNHAVVPEESLEWLAHLPATEVPRLIVTHYSIVPIDAKGTSYFEKNPDTMHFANTQAIMTALKQANAQVCINAHVHMGSYQQIQNIHFISNPAFSENIAGQNFPTNNPGIYSTLEIKDKNFVFSSYSNIFCFNKIQGTL